MTDRRCDWTLVGHPLCGKPATHEYVYAGEYAGLVKSFCAYHAGVARRDGWGGVHKIKATA